MPGRCGSLAVPALSADRYDRRGIGIEIFFGVGRGARALAEHVERIAELRMRSGAPERLLDGLADDEMRAEKPHRLPRRRPHGRQTEAARDVVEDRFRRFARMDDAGGDAERPGRGRDQECRRFDVAIEPAAGGELVLDQPVRGRGIGHAKQRLGQHHERETFLGRERIGVQKIFDAAESGRLGADRLDQAARARIDAALRGFIPRGLRKKARRQFLVRRGVWRREWC